MFLRAGTKHSIAKIALITNIPTSFYCIEKSYLQWPDFLWKDDVNNFLWTWHDPCIPELSSRWIIAFLLRLKSCLQKLDLLYPLGLWWHYLVILITVSYCCLRTTLVNRKILYLGSNVLAVIQYVWTLMKYQHHRNLTKHWTKFKYLLWRYFSFAFPKKNPTMYFSCLQSVSGWQLSKAFVYQHHAKFA